MKQFIHIVKTLLMISLCFVLVSSLFSLPVTAQENQPVVKVGYYQSAHFSEGHSDEELKSGYAYEYLQYVSGYTGWKYEYIYGEWTDLLQQLRNGEIDVMAGVSFSKDRAEEIAYPNDAMGYEDYYIFVPVESELQLSNGIRIGVMQDSFEYECITQWNEEHDQVCQIITYPGSDDVFQAVNDGSIDAIVDTDEGIYPEDGLKPLLKVGSSQYYLAVNKGRDDLLIQLNDAIVKMNEANPNLILSLRNKYFSNTAVQGSLTAEEKNWLEEKDEIRIAYEKNFMALCGLDENNELVGALKSFVDGMESNFDSYGLKITPVAYDNVQSSLEALYQGEVDAVFPVYECLYEVEKMNLSLSQKIVSTPIVAIVSSISFNEFADNRVAIANGFTDIEWFIEENYSNWQIYHFDTFDQCIDAVQNEMVDCVVESTYVYKTLVDYRTIKMVTLSKSAGISFAVRRGDTKLASILNRAIALNDDASFYSTLTQYANVEQKITFWEFAKDNIIAISIVAFVTMGVLFVLLMRAIDSGENAKRAKEQALSLYEAQQKNLTEIKVLNRELEAANKAKSTFLFNMSHDIRTPMNAIIGFTDLLHQNLDNKEKAQDYIQKIQRSNSFLLSLINNVLEMSRIEAGKMTLDEKVYNIEEFVESIVSVFSQTMHDKDIQFTTLIETAHGNIFCDPVKLREVYLNLISNAVKYTPNGGTVSLHVKELPCPKEGYCIIKTTLTDNGIGMSEEFVKHIFDEFARERNSTESKVEGTGLGMAIVKKLIDLMDGEISISSKRGVGTSIVVTLCHKIANGEELVEHQEEHREYDFMFFHNNRILLAEDNDLNAEIAVEILKDNGLSVERVMDGQQAVDKIEQMPEGYYDLILMDVQMPVMNGYDATKAIRALQSSKASIPILAMTANAFEEDKQQAKAAGMNGHIAKPIDVSEMLKEIIKYLK